MLEGISTTFDKSSGTRLDTESSKYNFFVVTLERLSENTPPTRFFASLQNDNFGQPLV